MFRYLRALWYAITGRFSAAAEALQSNKYVMSATYDKAIEKGADRFNTVKNAVAELMSIEQSRVQEIKELGVRAEKQAKIKSGAQVAMQRRINDLKTQGKGKEEIQVDPEFIKHSSAFKDASSTLAEIEARIEEKEKDLETRKGQIAKFKAELQEMQRGQQKLREEKSEALADVAVAQQMESVNAVLAGISEDTTDRDLNDAREARKKAKAKAEITADLAGNDARVAESEYLNLSASSEADRELDALLDWGEEDKGSMEDAKLPE